MHDFYYIQELKDQFFQRIFDEWSTKWSHFPEPENKDFNSLPNLTAFIEELYDELDQSLPKSLPVNQRVELMISRENLRRILKNHKNIRLQVHTRTCLAYYLGYDGWKGFKDHSGLDYIGAGLQQESEETEEVRVLINPRSSNRIVIIVLIVSISLLLGCLGIYYFRFKNDKATLVEDYSKRIIFEIVKKDSPIAPQTIFVKYDIKSTGKTKAKIIVNDVYGEKEYALSDSEGIFKYCFLHPTVRNIDLYLNEKRIKTITAFVPNETWESGYDGWNDLDPKKTFKNGVFHVPPSLIPIRKEYYTYLKKIHKYGVSGDNLSFETRLKNPRGEGGIPCYDVGFDLVGSTGGIHIIMVPSGCTYFGKVKVNNSEIRGWDKSSDFSDIGVDFSYWRDISIKTSEKMLYIIADKKILYSQKYTNNIGEILGVNISFRGSGSVDYVKISDNASPKVAFYDDFE